MFTDLEIMLIVEDFSLNFKTDLFYFEISQSINIRKFKLSIYDRYYLPHNSVNIVAIVPFSVTTKR